MVSCTGILANKESTSYEAYSSSSPNRGYSLICEANSVCQWFCVHFDTTVSGSLTVPLQHYKS